jgi:hypothetical protein
MTNTVDINIDERATLAVKINLVTPTGVLRDITGYSITWNATFNGDIVIGPKSTDLGNIVLGTPDINDVISSFSITFLPADTPLPDTKTYGVPIIYDHEARLTKASNQYIGIRGRMFIMPSQT